LKLFIGNLAFTTTINDLTALFSKFGEITDTIIPLRDGKSAGYGFVGFKDASSSTKAKLEMDGKSVSGRAIRVIAANLRDNKPGPGHSKMAQEDPDVLPMGFTMSAVEVSNDPCWFLEDEAFDLEGYLDQGGAEQHAYIRRIERDQQVGVAVAIAEPNTSNTQACDHYSDDRALLMANHDLENVINEGFIDSGASKSISPFLYANQKSVPKTSFKVADCDYLRRTNLHSKIFQNPQNSINIYPHVIPQFCC
jgi:hypothetical protein